MQKFGALPPQSRSICDGYCEQYLTILFKFWKCLLQASVFKIAEETTLKAGKSFQQVLACASWTEMEKGTHNMESRDWSQISETMT